MSEEELRELHHFETEQENAALKAEVERLQRLLDETDFALMQVRLRTEPAKARLDALVADLRELADEWCSRPVEVEPGYSDPLAHTRHAGAARLRAILDKHAGEQP